MALISSKDLSVQPRCATSTSQHDAYPRVNFRSYLSEVVIHFVGGSVDLLVRREAGLMYEGCASTRTWRTDVRVTAGNVSPAPTEIYVIGAAQDRGQESSKRSRPAGHVVYFSWPIEKQRTISAMTLLKLLLGRS